MVTHRSGSGTRLSLYTIVPRLDADNASAVANTKMSKSMHILYYSKRPRYIQRSLAPSVGSRGRRVRVSLFQHIYIFRRYGLLSTLGALDSLQLQYHLFKPMIRRSFPLQASEYIHFNTHTHISTIGLLSTLEHDWPFLHLFRYNSPLLRLLRYCRIH